MDMNSKKRKWIIENNILFNILEEGEKITIKIKGNSMLPFIVGDRDEVTLIKASTDSLQKGRIVVAHIDNKYYFLHRIVKIEGDKVTLQGDGNVYQKETCAATSILAEAVALKRKGKIYTPNSFGWKIAEKLWPSNPLLRRILLAIYRRI